MSTSDYSVVVFFFLKNDLCLVVAASWNGIGSGECGTGE